MRTCTDAIPADGDVFTCEVGRHLHVLFWMAMRLMQEAQAAEDFRLMVVLADVEGFSKEMAAILDAPIGTVTSRLYRGRQQLQ